ncbi:hypothetical protein D3C75_621610 [compost metagenome]
MAVRKHAAEHVLRPVRILILIDMNVLELLLVEIKHLGHFLEQLNRLHNQVVKIQRVVASQALLVLGIYLSDKSFKIIADLLLILRRSDQFILVRADDGLHRFGLKFLGVDIQILHTVADNRQLVR